MTYLLVYNKKDLVYDKEKRNEKDTVVSGGR